MPTYKRKTEEHKIALEPKVTSGNVEDGEVETPRIIEAPEATISSSYADELNWLNQKVEVTLNPVNDRNDTARRVTITINKYPYNFLKGEPKVVPRFVLEHIASAKRENVIFHGQKTATGNAQNVSSQIPYLKHPHSYRSLVASQSDRIKEAEWYQKCLHRHY